MENVHVLVLATIYMCSVCPELQWWKEIQCSALVVKEDDHVDVGW